MTNTTDPTCVISMTRSEADRVREMLADSHLFTRAAFRTALSEADHLNSSGLLYLRMECNDWQNAAEAIAVYALRVGDDKTRQSTAEFARMIYARAALATDEAAATV